MNELTKKQEELWHLAEKEMNEIAKKNNRCGYMGGMASITNNPDKSIRDRGNTRGTREWALLQPYGLIAPMNDNIFTDEYCQELIDMINA